MLLAVAVVMMEMVVAIAPGRGLGNTPSERDSCGEEQRAPCATGLRLPVPNFLDDVINVIVPQDSIATYVTSGTPVPLGGTAVWSIRIRREFGSKACMSPADNIL